MMGVQDFSRIFARIFARIKSLIGVLAQGSKANILPVLMHVIRVQGIFVGSLEMFPNMNAAIALHRLKPVIDRTFGFNRLPEALQLMEAGGYFGKIRVSI